MNKKIPFWGIVFLVGSISLFCAASFLCTAAANVLPRAVLFYNENGLGITFDEINTPFDAKIGIGAGSTRLAMQLSYQEVQEETVGSLLVSSAYNKVHKLTFLSGQFFSQETSPQAIVSQRFPNAVLGKAIILSGTSYTICGIIKEEIPFMPKNEFQSYGAILVNIPPEKGKEIQITALTLAAENEEGLRILQAEELAFALYGKVPAGEAQSLTEMAELLKQIPKIALLLDFLVVMIFITELVCKLAGRLYEKRITSLLKRLICVISIAGFLLLCFTVFSVILSSIQIPSSFLPQENIFDLRHYSDLISVLYSALEAPAGDCFSLQISGFYIPIAAAGYLVSAFTLAASIGCINKYLRTMLKGRLPCKAILR